MKVTSKDINRELAKLTYWIFRRIQNNEMPATPELIAQLRENAKMLNNVS